MSLPSPTPDIESDAGLRVLVVDDEAPARADLEFMLRRQLAIASVGVAADATEALRLLQADQYDAVFLDVRMPGLDGIELARRGAENDPAMKIVFITGFAAVALSAQSQAPKDAKVLSKPFHLKDLVVEIERVIAAA